MLIGNYGVNENEVESDGIKISVWFVKILVSIILPELILRKFRVLH
jgi:hypothetical protein